MNKSHLHDIEHQILTLHSTINLRQTLETAARIGELLLQVKAELGFGNYLPWLVKVGLPRRTARDYTAIAKSPNWRKSTHLSMDAFLTSIRNGRKALQAERDRERTQPPKTTAEHGILCADSLDWLKAQPDSSVPFFVSDPPYGVGLKYDTFTEANTADGHWAWFRPYWVEMCRVVQPGGAIILWQSYRYMRFFWDWFGKVDVIGYGFYVRGLRMWTPLVYWVKPGAKPLTRWGGNPWWMVGSQARRKSPRHPCPKPLEDCVQLIRLFTLPDTLVVDPFCGLASIPLACYLTGRKWVGIDRSAQYVEAARQRMHEHQSGMKKAA